MDLPTDIRASGPRIAMLPVLRLGNPPKFTSEHTDCVAVEEPLEIRLHGRPAAVLMRTPGGQLEDRELIMGFLFCEGVITLASQVLEIERLENVDTCQQVTGMTGTTVDVRLDSPSRGRGIERFFYSTSSCGACGKRSIDSLEVKGTDVGNGPMVTSGMLLQVLEDSRHQQALFTLTGGVHSSGLYTRAGARVELREDVGRHNALDKVIGARLIADCIPLANHILAISGRVGYEIIQKAAVAGIPLIVAVGAPTSLAVNLAAIHGITLAGFARAGTMNVYTHPQRIAI